MAIFRALQALAAIESGEFTSADLNALLADPGRYSEWQVLCSMEKQFDRMMSDGVQDIVLGSARAWNALASSVHPYIYDPSVIAKLAPSAWAVYLPHAQFITPAAPTSGGGGVGLWDNALSPGSRTLASPSVAQRPSIEFGTSPLTRQPAVRFDGTDDFMRCTQAFNQPTSYTIFIVYNTRTGAAGSGLIGARVGDTVAQGFYTFGDNNSSVRYINNNAVDSWTNTAAAPIGRWGLSRFRRESANLLYHSLNGGTESSPAALTSAIPGFTTDPLDVGRCWGTFMQGSISEVWLLAGNGNANSPEVQRVTAMLKAKYNL